MLALVAASYAAGAAMPRPPCGVEPFPAYPATGAAPVVQVWGRAEWTPPPCLPWKSSADSTIVATAARFHHTGGVEELRRRIGAVSAMKGLPYWSTSSRKWQPFILDAAALDGPSGARRKDFSVEEVAPDRALYLDQQDNLFGKGTFRLRVLQTGSDRLVFATENSSVFRVLGLSLAEPGDIQSVCFLDRESADVWRYYAIARTGKAASLLSAGHEASLINRAVASFRYLAGIPGDKEPPAAR